MPTWKKIVTSSGTSSQFIKGDGSLDSSTYLTSHQSLSGYAVYANPSNFTNLMTIEYSDISVGSNRGLRLLNTSGTDQQWNITAGVTGSENESFCIRDTTANVNVLTMAHSSGDAVFSGNTIISGRLQVGSVVDTGHKLHVDGHVGMTADLHLGSSRGINWAHGDASIMEGQSSNYALDFFNYDGSGNNYSLSLNPDHSSTFYGNAQFPNGYQVQWGGSSNAIFGHHTSGYVKIKTGGTDRMTINSDGDMILSNNLHIGQNSGGNRWINFSTTTGESGITWYETGTYSIPNHQHGAKMYYDESFDRLLITTRSSGVEKFHIMMRRASSHTEFGASAQFPTGHGVMFYDSAHQTSSSSANSGDYVKIQAPSSVGTSYTLSLPTNTGSANQVMKTDGSGNLSWTDVSSGGATEQYVDNYTDTAVDDLKDWVKANIGIIGQATEYTGTSTTKTLTTSFSQVNTTYFAVTFTAPASGKVLITAQFHQDASSSSRTFYYAISPSTPLKQDIKHRVDETDDVNQTIGRLVTGLTSGTSYTYYLYGKISAVNGYVRIGTSYSKGYMVAQAISY